MLMTKEIPLNSAFAVRPLVDSIEILVAIPDQIFAFFLGHPVENFYSLTNEQ